MKIKPTIISVFMLIAGFTLCFSQEQQNIEDHDAFKTLHVFNLKPEFSINDLQAILEKFNKLFVQLGHPESKYRLWEISEGKEKQFRYIWESNWNSKSVYDEIHENEEYRKLLKKEFIRLSRMFQDHTYNQYYELPFNETIEPESAQLK